jgi:hypothetical protein
MAKITGDANNNKKLGTEQADTISGLDGNDTLLGMGGNDSLLGGNGLDALDGGAGQDTLLGGSGNDSLNGGSGNDQLKGENGNDTLLGGSGGDTLDGGVGDDSLSGGGGNDWYVVNTIKDKVVETDKINSIDTVRSSVRYTLPDLVENLQLQGVSEIDGTGNGLNNQITGNSTDNLLSGLAGQDTLKGGDGADTLDGGAGIDSLVGGNDDDVYLVSSTEDKIVETAAGGEADEIHSSVSFSLVGNVEILTLTGAADLQGNGNERANILNGNSGANALSGEEGDDLLFGNEGDDALSGGLGDDQLDGGAGEDIASYDGNFDGYQITFDSEGNNWIIEDVDDSDGDDGTDTVVDVEQAKFADLSIDLTSTILPALSIDDVSRPEGSGSGNTAFDFTVSLSVASAIPVTVDYAILGDTATEGTDYTTDTGTLDFSPGETSKTISVAVKADKSNENDETFTVQLNNAVGAALAKSSGTGTIRNDDAVPMISIGNTQIIEGQSGSSNAVVTATLSAPVGQTVTVSYATVNGTATAGSDYTARTGVLTFNPGETSRQISIPIAGDGNYETDETFTVALSKAQNATLSPGAATAKVTIQNDDVPPVLAIGDIQVEEGDSGSASAALTVSLSKASSLPVTVSYATVNGTAIAGSDYTARTGVLTFNPGDTSRQISIPIAGDRNYETDETFTVALSKAQNATLDPEATTAQVTIQNDDAPPVLAIGDIQVEEGDNGSAGTALTVSLSKASPVPVTVNYASSDGTAFAGQDYGAVFGTLTFNPGETSKIIDVPVMGNTRIEPDKIFQVSLDSPGNATLDPVHATASVTILNDDSYIFYFNAGNWYSDERDTVRVPLDDVEQGLASGNATLVLQAPGRGEIEQSIEGWTEGDKIQVAQAAFFSGSSPGTRSVNDGTERYSSLWSSENTVKYAVGRERESAASGSGYSYKLYAAKYSVVHYQESISIINQYTSVIPHQYSQLVTYRYTTFSGGTVTGQTTRITTTTTTKVYRTTTFQQVAKTSTKTPINMVLAFGESGPTWGDIAFV